MFQITCDRGISTRTKKRLIHVAHWLEEEYPFRTKIKLILRNRCCIRLPTLGRCWGCYNRINKTMQLACGCKAPTLLEHMDTLIHEFVHYEQAHRGQRMNHRGMRKRVLSLLTKYLNRYKIARNSRIFT
jgi:hypothetical protein